MFRAVLKMSWGGLAGMLMLTAACVDDGTVPDTGPDAGIDLGVDLGPNGQPGPSACADPNPHRAVISEELTEMFDYLFDGSFEEGDSAVLITDHRETSLDRAPVERVQGAARTGSWGYAVTAGPQQGVNFSIRGYVEKGEDIRFSAWVRSLDGEVSLQPVIFWVDDGGWGQPEIGDRFTVGEQWTQLVHETETTEGVLFALMSLEVGPNTALHIDDAAVELPIWRIAEYDGDGRSVGGIEVSLEPAAPVHFSVLIHIEDPPMLHTNRAFFEEQTARMRELARVLHEHGGFLTIQPEQDWIIGAEESGFHPGLLAELAEDYGVVYSTHTHGPRCRDDRGVLRSHTDCNQQPQWDRIMDDDDVIEYVAELRDRLEAASGLSVTDQNGNWEFSAASRYAEIPMLTWSAYKNHNDQRTYDRLIINPWRPTECDADADIERFMTHDPETDIVYVPGWGQAISRHPDRIPTRLPPMLSQVIRFADPDRVNAFHIVTHVGHYYSRTDDPDYIAYDDRTGEVSLSDEYLQHLQVWDDVLTETIDPLVEAGYLRWTSLSEVGQLYLEWEAACAE